MKMNQIFNENINLSQNFLYSTIPTCHGNNLFDTTPNKSGLSFFNQYEIPLNEISSELAKCCSFQEKIRLNSQNITERQMIIDKLQTTVWKLGSSKDILYYAIYLMDIIIEKYSKESKAIIRLEEVAMGSLFLSIKFNQYCNHMPPLRMIQMIFEPNYYYTKDQMKSIEFFCLKHTNYNLSLMSPLASLEFVIKRGIIFPSDFLKESEKLVQLKLVTYSREIMKKIVKKSNEYCIYNQLHLSISIICYSREKKQLTKWNEGFEFLYDITQNKIQKAYTFLLKILTEKRQVHINNYYYMDTIMKKRKQIKVQTSASIKDMNRSSRYRTNTIESYRKKSQRSTSASLDETTMIKQRRMKTQPRKNNLYSISYNKANQPKKINSSILNEPNTKYATLRKEESYRQEYAETIPMKAIPNQKCTINTSMNNSVNLNQSNHAPYKKLSFVQELKKETKTISTRHSRKKENLNQLLFNIECKRKIESSKEKQKKKTINQIVKPKEIGLSLKKIKQALTTAQTNKKIKKLATSLTLVEFPVRKGTKSSITKEKIVKKL